MRTHATRRMLKHQETLLKEQICILEDKEEKEETTRSGIKVACLRHQTMLLKKQMCVLWKES